MEVLLLVHSMVLKIHKMIFHQLVLRFLVLILTKVYTHKIHFGVMLIILKTATDLSNLSSLALINTTLDQKKGLNFKISLNF